MENMLSRTPCMMWKNENQTVDQATPPPPSSCPLPPPPCPLPPPPSSCPLPPPLLLPCLLPCLLRYLLSWPLRCLLRCLLPCPLPRMPPIMWTSHVNITGEHHLWTSHVNTNTSLTWAWGWLLSSSSLTSSEEDVIKLTMGVIATAVSSRFFCFNNATCSSWRPCTNSGSCSVALRKYLAYFKKRWNSFRCRYQVALS